MLEENSFGGLADSNTEAPIRRGPGRPPGSLNRPKGRPLSPEARAALKDKLGADYRDAIIGNMLARTRAKGVRSLILAKLDREALAEIEAGVIAAVEDRANAPTKEETAIEMTA